METFEVAIEPANGVKGAGHTNSSTNFQRKAPSGVNVLIVGAGIGGMMAAIELHRQGHDVKIVEAKDAMEGLGKYKRFTSDLHNLRT